MRRRHAGAALPRTLAAAVVMAVVAGFAALNWAQLAAPVPVSFGVATVSAPLGLIMLGLLALLGLLFTAWALSLQASMLRETRRHSRELQAQRELADRAEASRFTELRRHLDAVAAELRTAQEQAVNSTAAYLGEIEDRLAHPPPMLPPDVPPQH